MQSNGFISDQTLCCDCEGKNRNSRGCFYS
nr:MAG TPA: hypothetical protein [Bacteriophage sp.]